MAKIKKEVPVEKENVSGPVAKKPAPAKKKRAYYILATFRFEGKEGYVCSLAGDEQAWETQKKNMGQNKVLDLTLHKISCVTGEITDAA